jgi:site-specific DNA-methyltransferase (adenine-specific)
VKELEFHEVTNLFPPMGEDEFEQFKANIAVNKQSQPIWTWQGKIIDGRHRYRACKELGIEPWTQEWDGKGSLVAFVWSLNGTRRHLSKGQLAAVAAEILPLLEKEARERQQAGGRRKVPQKVGEPSGGNHDGEAAGQAAKIFSTNRQYVADAKRLMEGAPELHAKVKAGTMTLPQARNEVRRREKRQALEAKAAAARKDPPSCRITHGDCLVEVRRLKAGSARQVFADTRYNNGTDYYGKGAAADRQPDDEYLGWCRQWMGAYACLLTPDGSFWVMISDEYVADFFCILKYELGLTFRNWIKWYETFGENCTDKFNRTSRHILYFVKDPRSFVFHPEAVTRLSDRQAKYADARADPGGKLWDDVWVIPRLTGTSKERLPFFDTQLPLDLLRAVVGCASDPGDLVVDPFSGSGTTGAACLELGRHFIGIEENGEAVRLSRLRLRAAVGEQK